MNKLPQHLKPFLQICKGWVETLSDLPDDIVKIDFMSSELPKLLKDPSFFRALLNNMVQGNPYPDILSCGIFEHEFPLFVDPGGRFSLRLTLFGPGMFTPVHDHNSWGVIGSPTQGLEVFKYIRKDDQSKDGIAELAESDHRVLNAGETDFTLSLDDGIHKTGNGTSNTILMLSVYGRPIRRLFVNGFDLKKNTVYPMHPPKIKRKMLAKQALDNLGGL
jgi:hypothetical protein